MCHSDTETQRNKHTLRSHLFIGVEKKKARMQKCVCMRMCVRLFIPKGGQRSKVKHLQEKKDLSVAHGGMAKRQTWEVKNWYLIGWLPDSLSLTFINHQLMK